MAALLDQILQLVLKIRGDSTEAEQSLNNLKSGVQGAVAPSKLLRGAMLGVSAALAQGTKLTNELSQEMSKFQAQTGATTEEVEDMRLVMKALWSQNEDTYASIVGMATRLRQEFSASAEDVEKYGQAFLDFGKVNKMSGEAAVDLANDVAEAWSLSLEDTIPLLDKFMVATQRTGISSQELGSTLRRAAPQIQALGLNMEEAMGFMIGLKESGVDSRYAMQAFMRAVQHFKSPEEFKAFFTQLAGIEDQLEASQVASEVFGMRAGPAIAKAVREGTLDIENLTNILGENEGAVTTASAAWDKNFNVRMALWRKRIQSMAQGLVENLGPGVSMVSSAIMGMNALMPGLFRNLSQWVNLNKITAAAQKLLNVVMSANPIAIVVLAIAALVAALIYLYNNVEGVRDFIDKAWSFIKDKTTAIFTGVKEAVGKAAEWLSEKAELIRTTFVNVWKAMADRVSAIWNSLVGAIKRPINAIIGMVNSFIRSINSISIKIPEVNIPFVGKVGGGTIGFPKISEIPLLAKGGRALRSGWAVIGEEGPELAYVNRGVVVEPLGAAGKDIRDVTVNVYQNIKDRATADYAMGEMVRIMRNLGETPV